MTRRTFIKGTIAGSILLAIPMFPTTSHGIIVTLNGGIKYKVSGLPEYMIDSTKWYFPEELERKVSHVYSGMYMKLPKVYPILYGSIR